MVGSAFLRRSNFQARGPQTLIFQRWRDDKEEITCLLRGVGLGGREGNDPKALFFAGSATTKHFLKVKILVSRNLVVIAQAPTF